MEGHRGWRVALNVCAAAFPLDVSVQERSSRRSQNAREVCPYRGIESRYFHTSADQSRKPKCNFVLTAYILTRHIIYIFIYSYIYFFLYISSLRFFSLCISLLFSTKIISSAARFVALVRHLPGDGAPETGNRARTGCLRPGYRPINTRTGSPVPATWESPSDGR